MNFVVLSLLLNLSSYAKIATYGFNPSREGQFGVNLVEEQDLKSLNMVESSSWRDPSSLLF